MPRSPEMTMQYCMHSIVPQFFFTGSWNSIRFNISGHEIAFISTTRAMIFGPGWWRGAIGPWILRHWRYNRMHWMILNLKVKTIFEFQRFNRILLSCREIKCTEWDSSNLTKGYGVYFKRRWFIHFCFKTWWTERSAVGQRHQMWCVPTMDSR